MGGRRGLASHGVAIAFVVSACSGKIDPTAGSASSSGSPSPTGSETASDLLFGPCIVVPLPTSECRDIAKALAICAEKGFAFRSLTTEATSCEARCCAKSPPTSSTPTACSMEAIGDRTSCIPHTEIKTRAVGLCDARGKVVREVYSTDDCPAGATAATVECCAK